ncbi:MAG: hypothetical protein IJV54_05500 [Bacteroidales bacterium]|nr:hypothetical protein [Bacteroidales bacterium]
MAKIYTTAQLAALSDEEYRAYVSEILEEERVLNVQATSFNDGRKLGREEERMAIAKSLLIMELSVEDVAKATHLSMDEVNSLKENLDQ